MNWAAVAFDWNQVRAFLATVEEGSLSAAARALGQTQPTLGRQVAGLEQALGVVLFERVGHGLTLTPTGRDLLAHVRPMAEAASRLSLAAEARGEDLDGLVRISASDVFSTYILPPLLARLRAAAPRIRIEVVAENTLSDLQQREADIAIRHVRPVEPELIARLIHQTTAHFYAAPDYLDRHGRPETTAELAGHDFIAFGAPDRMIEYLRPLGIDLSPENFPLGATNGVAGWHLACEGLGIAPMSDAVAAATPGMERLLPGMQPISFPVWLTTHRELQQSRRIRLVYDFLAEALPPAL